MKKLLVVILLWLLSFSYFLLTHNSTPFLISNLIISVLVAIWLQTPMIRLDVAHSRNLFGKEAHQIAKSGFVLFATIFLFIVTFIVLTLPGHLVGF